MSRLPATRRLSQEPFSRAGEPQTLTQIWHTPGTRGGPRSPGTGPRVCLCTVSLSWVPRLVRQGFDTRGLTLCLLFRLPLLCLFLVRAQDWTPATVAPLMRDGVSSPGGPRAYANKRHLGPRSPNCGVPPILSQNDGATARLVPMAASAFWMFEEGN